MFNAVMLLAVYTVGVISSPLKAAPPSAENRRVLPTTIWATSGVSQGRDRFSRRYGKAPQQRRPIGRNVAPPSQILVFGVSLPEGHQSKFKGSHCTKSNVSGKIGVSPVLPPLLAV